MDDGRGEEGACAREQGEGAGREGGEGTLREYVGCWTPEPVP